jgi:ribosomal silencing factor RsfS
MSDVLQEIKDYLESIELNAVYAENATTVERYEMYKKTVIDCKEAVLSLFQNLEREYWELLERFGQLQTKLERYEKL